MKNKKTKNQVIVVGNALTKRAVKTKKLLKTPRSPVSKENTVSYYDCLISEISSPVNDRVRITNLTHKCKCSKAEIAKTKAEVKHKLVHELAKNYKEIGENLGRYVKADIVGCAKELGKTKLLQPLK